MALTEKQPAGTRRANEGAHLHLPSWPKEQVGGGAFDRKGCREQVGDPIQLRLSEEGYLEFGLAEGAGFNGQSCLARLGAHTVMHRIKHESPSNKTESRERRNCVELDGHIVLEQDDQAACNERYGYTCIDRKVV